MAENLLIQIDLDPRALQMSINVFRTISALKSTILVYVYNLSYTQDGVVNI